MSDKILTYKDLDSAVKAAYALGKLDGANDVRTQMEEMRVQLQNMLTTNKHLFRVQLDDMGKTKGMPLSPTVIKNILLTLKKADYHQYVNLKLKYNAFLKQGER